MRVCGVEIKNNEAVVCILSMSDGVFDLPDCRARVVSVGKLDSQSVMQGFQASFKKLMEDYSIVKVVVLERMKKGKFAGPSLSFKLEAAIQLMADIDVELVSPAEFKNNLKEHPLPVDFNETGLKPFQENAFLTAFGYLSSSTS